MIDCKPPSKKLAALLIVVCFGLAGCQLNGNKQAFPPPTIDSKLVDQSLLTGDPCVEPCWQGITPNTTNRDDAMQILENIDFVDPECFEYREVANGPDRLLWSSSITHQIGGVLRVGHDDIIKITEVQISYDLNISKLIEIKDQPDGMLFSPDPYNEVVGVSIIWLGKGFQVSAFVPYQAGKADIRSDLELIGVEYFAPVNNVVEYFGEWNMDPRHFYTWKGYQVYDFSK